MLDLLHFSIYLQDIQNLEIIFNNILYLDLTI